MAANVPSKTTNFNSRKAGSLRASRKGGSGGTKHRYSVCCFQILIARFRHYPEKIGRTELQSQKEDMIIEELLFG